MPSLRDLILGQISAGAEQGGMAARQALQQQGEADLLRQKLAGEQQMMGAKKGMLEELLKGRPDAAVGVEGVSVHPMNPQAALNRKEKAKLSISKGLEELQEPMSALKEMDALTNASGQGGILSNPEAHIKGTGRVASGLPTSAIAAGEALQSGAQSLGKMLGIKVPEVIEPGAAEERKALERIQVSAHNLIKRPNVRLDARQQQALGMIMSADPDLAKKGVLAFARATKDKARMLMAADPEASKELMQEMGGDPTEFLARIPEPGPSKAAVLIEQPAPSAAKPSMSSEARQARIAELRRKLGK